MSKDRVDRECFLQEGGLAPDLSSCYFERHLYFDYVSFELSISPLGDVDREIIHVSVSFSNLMDQMRVIHNLEALGLGCKQRDCTMKAEREVREDKLKHWDSRSATTWSPNE